MKKPEGQQKNYWKDWPRAKCPYSVIWPYFTENFKLIKNKKQCTEKIISFRVRKDIYLMVFLIYGWARFIYFFLLNLISEMFFLYFFGQARCGAKAGEYFLSRRLPSVGEKWDFHLTKNTFLEQLWKKWAPFATFLVYHAWVSQPDSLIKVVPYVVPPLIPPMEQIVFWIAIHVLYATQGFLLLIIELFGFCRDTI